MRMLAPDEGPREEGWVPCGLGPCWAEEGHAGPCMPDGDESHEREHEMTDENVIETAEGLDALTPGEWVIDADGDALCLVDTYLGWPQRMWMPKAKAGRVGLVVSLEHAAFPVHLAEIDPEYTCKHGRGTNECGHCYLCGVVVGERRERHFDAETMAIVREAGRMNAAYDEAHRSGDES